MNTINSISFGCVADDFTGASDAASFLAAGGLSTILVNGVPGPAMAPPDDADAVVVALKTRTRETAAAVADTLESLRRLDEMGAGQFYIKYCSTFDSTPKGNIGPVCDAAMDLWDAPYTLLCPSLPVNGRTVREGRLYVDGVPLERTHMRSHPLTPMWDSFIPELMRGQSRYPCFLVSAAAMSGEAAAIGRQIEAYRARGKRFYLIPDYQTDSDAARIVQLFGDLKLLTGGSGLLAALAGRHRRYGDNPVGGAGKAGQTAGADRLPPCGSKAVLLAGSCSAATQAQVGRYLAEGGYGIMLDPEKLSSGGQDVEAIGEEIRQSGQEDILIYSPGSAGHLTGGERESHILEEGAARLARIALDSGYTRFIVAGGETSGAVVGALGWSAFQIGASVAPGVPVMIPLGVRNARLVLKSGNFGQEDFFRRALALTKDGNLMGA